MKREPLLEVCDLRTYFYIKEGTVKAVDGISFNIGKGESVGLVGESGCGKTVTALSILKLVPSPPGKIVSGKVLLEGENLLKLGDREIRQVRGSRISMVFQDPMTSLNPVMKIEEQIAESIRLHRKEVPREEVHNEVVKMVDKVGIADPKGVIDGYPHMLSGGMRQRVLIAIALSCNPQLVILDEPTTALDVTIQAQIIELVRQLQKDFDMSILLITHDFGVVTELCEKVVVMYAGKIVEIGDIKTILTKPLHPYTRLLLRSLPRLDVKQARLETVPGIVPDLIDLPLGCAFAPRCPKATDGCRKMEPELVELEPGHLVSWLPVCGE